MAVCVLYFVSSREAKQTTADLADCSDKVERSENDGPQQLIVAADCQLSQFWIASVVQG